jgi:hypothetical protein
MAATLGGCVAYYPAAVPAPGPSTFDRSFDAALNAAADSGVTVTSADRASGRIVGSKAGAAVTINLQRQGDGSVRIEFGTQASTQTNPTLAEQLNLAYERRMGR